jgi:hypothetical protein
VAEGACATGAVGCFTDGSGTPGKRTVGGVVGGGCEGTGGAGTAGAEVVGGSTRACSGAAGSRSATASATTPTTRSSTPPRTANSSTRPPAGTGGSLGSTGAGSPGTVVFALQLGHVIRVPALRLAIDSSRLHVGQRNWMATSASGAEIDGGTTPSVSPIPPDHNRRVTIDTKRPTRNTNHETPTTTPKPALPGS